MPTFELNGIDFEVVRPNQLETSEYDALRDIEASAFRFAIPDLTQEELDFYLHADDPDEYARTRRDPRALIEEGRMNPNQDYDNPLIAVAYDGDGPVGYAYTADNVSGSSPQVIAEKKQHDSKVYRWLRIVAVHPELQGRGIAHKLVQLSLEKARPAQKATAYTWPELVPKMDGLLTSWGFEVTNEDDPQLVFPFGHAEVSRAVEQYRYQAESARASAALIAREHADRAS